MVILVVTFVTNYSCHLNKTREMCFLLTHNAGVNGHPFVSFIFMYVLISNLRKTSVFVHAFPSLFNKPSLSNNMSHMPEGHRTLIHGLCPQQAKYLKSN